MNQKIFPAFEKIPVTGRLRVCLELAKNQKLVGKVIVDIGSSNGLLAYHLLREKPAGYIGIDPSENAIQFAKKNVPSATFFQSTADKLPIKSGVADVALMFDVIEHVPTGTEVIALKEIARVLKKGGKLILSTPHSHFLTNILDPAWYMGHRHYQVKQIHKFLKKSGFEVISSEVRGGIWFSIYLICLYISKWIFKKPDFRNKLLEAKDDQQFSQKGIHTIYVICRKS